MSVFGTYSQYYDLLYKDKDYAGEAQYIHSLISTHAPQAKTVLNLGCGTGRHDYLLAEKGYKVTGVDISDKMLAEARAKKGQGKKGTDIPDFVHGDIRTVQLDKQFDVVLSLFHVMSYMTADEDIVAACQTIRTHLKTGGVAIFDCWYGPAVLTMRPEVKIKRMENEHVQLTRISEPTLLYDKNMVEVHYTIFSQEKKNGKITTLKEVHPMRYFFYPELDMLLRQEGLHLEHSEEWITGNPSGPSTWGVCFIGKKV